MVELCGECFDPVVFRGQGIMSLTLWLFMEGQSVYLMGFSEGMEFCVSFKMEID